jgi:hypothetical protein
MKTRRKRSHMTEDDCLAAFKSLSKRVDRMLTGSHGIEPHTFAKTGEVSVCLSVKGGFGVADEFFEAVRVFAGHKLPAFSEKP